MAKKPTAEDAQLILQLYDLRREAAMRKARHWWLKAANVSRGSPSARRSGGRPWQKPRRGVCQPLVGRSPVSRGGEQLQSDGVGTIFQGLAVNDARPRTKIAQE